MSSFLDFLSELVPPVLYQPATYDLDKLGLLLDRQLVDSIQQLCKTHPDSSSSVHLRV